MPIIINICPQCNNGFFEEGINVRFHGDLLCKKCSLDFLTNLAKQGHEGAKSALQLYNSMVEDDEALTRRLRKEMGA